MTACDFRTFVKIFLTPLAASCDGQFGEFCCHHFSFPGPWDFVLRTCPKFFARDCRLACRRSESCKAASCFAQGSCVRGNMFHRLQFPTAGKSRKLEIMSRGRANPIKAEKALSQSWADRHPKTETLKALRSQVLNRKPAHHPPHSGGERARRAAARPCRLC